jgi:hypothetical protein
MSEIPAFQIIALYTNTTTPIRFTVMEGRTGGGQNIIIDFLMPVADAQTLANNICAARPGAAATNGTTTTLSYAQTEALQGVSNRI